MTITLPAAAATVRQSTNQEVIAELQDSLDRKYRGLLAAARKRWERRFTGKDPSDACVSVTISSAPSAGPGRLACVGRCV